MSFQLEQDIATEQVKSYNEAEQIAEKELVESKSKRLMKPSRKLKDIRSAWKKSKSKKVPVRFSAKSTDISKAPVDKTAAVDILSSTQAVCGYCHKGHQDDPLKSGKMFSINGVVTHYFCMLFTYNSQQLGNDDEGLFGFFGVEVKQQIKNGKKKLCKYCSKSGATARCNKKHCNVMMHFPCGQEVGATFQFTGKMLVFCKVHRVRQKVETYPTPPDMDCVICYESVDQGLMSEFKRLRAPCCGRHLHRNCVQRFAMSSGTQHFKCPNCNNVHDISKEVKKCGVYLPYKDAEWELPAQSSFYNFQDMYIQTKRCNVKNCISKETEGRNFNGVESEFEIVLCDTCGTNGVHIKCADINEETLDYICVDCGGEVELEPLGSSTSSSNSFASLESSLNLSLASSGNDSLCCEKEETPSESIQSIRDLLKQFETDKSEDGMATFKITSSLDKPIDDSNANITLDSLLDTSEESEPSPTITECDSDTLNETEDSFNNLMSRTQLINNESPGGQQPTTENEKSTHNFFKETEEMTRILEDLKKKEQEKKAKDAFLKSIADAQSSVKKEVLEKNKGSNYDFGMYLARSLGVKTTNTISEVQNETEDKNVGCSKIVGNSFVGVRKASNEEVLKSVSLPSINVRTDLFSGANVMNALNICEVEMVEQKVRSDDNESDNLGLEISDNKRQFGLSLLKKLEKSELPVFKKQNIFYIDSFYKYMEKANKVSEVNELSVISSDVESNKKYSTEETSVTKEVHDNELVVDYEIISNIVAPSPVNRKIQDSTILEIVDNSVCSDSFIDELLASPEKSTNVANINNDPLPLDGELLVNDANGSKIEHLTVDVTALNEPSEIISIVDSDPVSSVSPVDIPETVEIVETTPVKADSATTKYKPGPRSRTRPNTKTTERTSPTKIKASIAENIKLFEEQSKSLKSKSSAIEAADNVTASISANIPEEIAFITKDKKDPNEVEETVKYKPGPKSRKKFLLIKESKTQSSDEQVKPPSPKRSSESVADTSAKKLKVDENVLNPAEVVNLDTTPASSDNSSLEIIDLETSVIETEMQHKKDIATSAKEGDRKKDDDIIEEIHPTDTIPTAVPTLVSKRASKRPYLCPVCQGYFRSEMVLQQHLAKIHFWNRLMALPKEGTTSSGTVYTCSEFPCRYVHKSQNIVAGHLATEHKVVFRIALNIFPDFKLPVLNSSNTISDSSITIVASVPTKLPTDPTVIQNTSTESIQEVHPPAASLEYSNKRNSSDLIIDLDDQNTKKSKTGNSKPASSTARPIMLPTQPHKAVAMVKPRTAPVKPSVLDKSTNPSLYSAPAPSPLYNHNQFPHPPFSTEGPTLPYPTQGYFYPGYTGGFPIPVTAPGQYVQRLHYDNLNSSYTL